MKAPIGIWLVLYFFAIMHCAGQGTLNITFDGPPPQPTGTSYFVQQYSELGMWFRPIGPVGPGNGFSRRGGGISAAPENGTAYIAAALGDSLMFSFTNGSVFNLDAVDLAEYSTTVPDAVTVHFIGYRPDGSTVTTDFTTDGIIDGTGPLADFQTFNFQGFTGLSRVEIPTYGWSLDNLMVTPVPEPGTGALLALAAALAGIRWFKRKP